MRKFWNGKKWFAGVPFPLDCGLHDGGLQSWRINPEERCELSNGKSVVGSGCSCYRLRRAGMLAADFLCSQRVFLFGGGNRKVARMFFVVKQPSQRTPPLDGCSGVFLMVCLPDVASLWQVWRECAVSY